MTRLATAIAVMVFLLPGAFAPARAEEPPWWCENDGWTLGLFYDFFDPAPIPPDSFCVAPTYFTYEQTIWGWTGPFQWHPDWPSAGGNGVWVLPRGSVGTLRITFDNWRVTQYDKYYYARFAVWKDPGLWGDAWLETESASTVREHGFVCDQQGWWFFCEMWGVIEPQPYWETLVLELDATNGPVVIDLVYFGTHCEQALPVEIGSWGLIKSTFRDATR